MEELNWPAIVKFDNNDELEIIDNQNTWEGFLQSVSTDCRLILSDSTQYSISVNSHAVPQCKACDSPVSIETAVALARKHMAAQSHCCVSKFSATSLKSVIQTLIQLEE